MCPVQTGVYAVDVVLDRLSRDLRIREEGTVAEVVGADPLSVNGRGRGNVEEGCVGARCGVGGIGEEGGELVAGDVGEVGVDGGEPA
jgi:hypothetical protein